MIFCSVNWKRIFPWSILEKNEPEIWSPVQSLLLSKYASLGTLDLKPLESMSGVFQQEWIRIICHTSYLKLIVATYDTEYLFLLIICNGFIMPDIFKIYLPPFLNFFGLPPAKMLIKKSVSSTYSCTLSLISGVMMIPNWTTVKMTSVKK